MNVVEPKASRRRSHNRITSVLRRPGQSKKASLLSASKPR